MNGRKIYILTGDVQSGKTTALMQWTSGRKDVFGILSPVVSGRRVFLNICTGEQFEMEAKAGEKNTITVGKFIFSKAAFQQAENILRKGFQENRGWLIIDEAGPLELRGEGFSEIIKEILGSSSVMAVLFVIRENFIEKVMDYFQLNRKTIQILDKQDILLKP